MAYSVDPLDLPSGHTEADLRSGLLNQLRTFLIDLGRDFCFVGSQLPVCYSLNSQGEVTQVILARGAHGQADAGGQAS